MSLTLQNPPVKNPELATLPGMGAVTPGTQVTPGVLAGPHDVITASGANIPDTSIGPVQLEVPASWTYDFDPANGISRATYIGELNIPGGIPGLPYLPLTGGTVTGEIILQSTLAITAGTLFVTGGSGVFSQNGVLESGLATLGAAGATVNIRTAAGNRRAVEFFSGTNLILDIATSGAESGGNAGGNLVVDTYSDTGTLLTTPVTINRATGAISLTTSLTPAQTAGIVGTNTNNNANAGSVGELITSAVASPGAAVTSGTFAAITSVTLTPGDWDVFGFVSLIPAGTPSYLNYGVSNVTTAIAGYQTGFLLPFAGTAATEITAPMSEQRISVAANTTINLTAVFGFTSTATAFGTLSARRRR